MSLRSSILILVYSVGVFILGMLAFKHEIPGKIKNSVRGVIASIENSEARSKAANIPVDRISISMEPDEFEKLALQRELAMKYGGAYRTHELNTGWRKCQLEINGESLKAKIRLKGGQIDHFGHEYKWSFKIKLKGDGRYQGMKKFALQLPQTRGFMNEPVLHWFLDHHGLISLNYSFVEAQINDNHLGIYMLEENMHPYVLAHNQLREGLILSVNDDLLWTDDLSKTQDVFSLGQVDFNEKKVEESEEFQRQFKLAQDLFNSFRTGKLATSQVFATEKLAMMFAICDLFGMHHATYLYNLKFYYDPVTSKLEPICYDNQKIYPLSEPKKHRDIENHGKLCGEFKPLSLREGDSKTSNWHEAVFSDTVFYGLYITALQTISKKNHFQQFIDSYQQKLDSNISILHRSFPDYSFNEELRYVVANTKYIRRFLELQNGVNAHFEGYNEATHSLTISVFNTSTVPLIVDSLKLKGVDQEVALTKISTDYPTYRSSILPPGPRERYTFTAQLPEGLDWTQEMKRKLKVEYAIYGTDGNRVKTKVQETSSTEEGLNVHDLMRLPQNLDEFDFIVMNKERKEIRFNTKFVKIEKSLIIPEGYRVIGAPGLNIDITNGAEIISHSPWSLKGSPTNPILVFSSDSTGEGLLTIDPKGGSEFEYVNFVDLSNTVNHNHSLTGGVTFYDADVSFDHCIFKGNKRGDDLLNLIRSEFDISDSRFENINADAFDGDFVSGSVLRTQFINVGNDAIDVSGSDIIVRDVIISYVEDKGISAGENSRIDVVDTEVNGSELAFTSKDLSHIEATNVKVEDSKVGFVVFQKKPEFGSASINISGVTSSNVEVQYLIEEGSSIWLDKSEAPSEKIADVKGMLYGKEYGKKSVR